jgi:hypothetical protein
MSANKKTVAETVVDLSNKTIIYLIVGVPLLIVLFIGIVFVVDLVARP